MQRWVMVCFSITTSGELNYSNPEVADPDRRIFCSGPSGCRVCSALMRWPFSGSGLAATCQNERKAHLILQLLKTAAKVTAPSVLLSPRRSWRR